MCHLPPLRGDTLHKNRPAGVGREPGREGVGRAGMVGQPKLWGVGRCLLNCLALCLLVV